MMDDFDYPYEHATREPRAPRNEGVLKSSIVRHLTIASRSAHMLARQDPGTQPIADAAGRLLNRVREL